MDPSTVLCATETCPDKGRVGAGNISIHSQKKRRYRQMSGHVSKDLRLHTDARHFHPN